MGLLHPMLIAECPCYFSVSVPTLRLDRHAQYLLPTARIFIYRNVRRDFPLAEVPALTHHPHIPLITAAEAACRARLRVDSFDPDPEPLPVSEEVYVADDAGHSAKRGPQTFTRTASSSVKTSTSWLRSSWLWLLGRPPCVRLGGVDLGLSMIQISALTLGVFVTPAGGA